MDQAGNDPDEFEADILSQAQKALRAETGIELKIKRRGFTTERPDAEVSISGHPECFSAEVKRWAQHTNFGALVHQLKANQPNPLLVADYVNPKLAQRLRAEKISFIDTAGNAYLDSPPLFIYIEGRKSSRSTEPHPKPTTIFDTSGLKVVFALLCEPTFASATYRDIAQHCQVALGTVGKIINSLKSNGYLVEDRRSKGRRLTNQKKLMDRWVEAYPEKLRPKLLVGHFQAPSPYWWKEVDLKNYRAYWSGEVAAAKYTNYLKPSIGTVYLSPSSGTKLLTYARLRKAYVSDGEEEGLVWIYRSFWSPEIEPTDLAHPILVYADLIATGDSRNLETAKLIYEDHIRRHFGEA